MTTESYASELHEFIEQWVKNRNTTWESLLNDAGVTGPVGTNIRKGSTPRPDTLRKLADVMNVPRRKIFELAGYVRPEELEPENIDIEDPEIRLFFRQYEWGDFTDHEKEIIRQAIRMAKAYKDARDDEPPPAAEEIDR